MYSLSVTPCKCKLLKRCSLCRTRFNCVHNCFSSWLFRWINSVGSSFQCFGTGRCFSPRTCGGPLACWESAFLGTRGRSGVSMGMTHSWLWGGRGGRNVNFVDERFVERCGNYFSLPAYIVWWTLFYTAHLVPIFCVGILDLFRKPVGNSPKLWFLEMRLRKKIWTYLQSCALDMEKGVEIETDVKWREIEKIKK